MVIDKLKSLIGLVSGTISHPLGSSRFIFVRTYGCRVVGLCSRGRGGVPDPRPGKKGEK